MSKGFWASAISIIGLVISSCGTYHDAQKSKNPSFTFNVALEHYKIRKYAKALVLFEKLLDYYRGKDSAETVYYYIAYSHYGMGLYTEAALYFKDFNDNFFHSTKNEECAYMEVYCSYLGSQNFELDQSGTVETINKLQIFMNRYPNSVYVTRCNEYMDNLRKQLHKKSYAQTLQYYRMGHYLAAMTMAKNTLREYPDIDQTYKEELEYTAVKAGFLYAENSIENKKEERFLEALEAYKDYRQANTATALHSAEVEELKLKITKELERISQNK